MSLTLGVPLELSETEKRVALVPEVIGKFCKLHNVGVPPTVVFISGGDFFCHASTIAFLARPVEEIEQEFPVEMALSLLFGLWGKLGAM